MKYFTILLIAHVLYWESCPLFAQSPGSVNSEIQLWLKANSGTLNGSLIANDGDSVSRWQDQSGVRVNHANASSTARPRYRNNASSNINYNPVMEFNGSTNGMNYGNDYILAPADKSGVTYLAVAKPDLTTSKGYQYIYDFGHFTTFGYGMYLSDDRCGFYTPNTEVSSTRANDTLPVLIHQDINFNDYRALYLNGSTTAFVNSTLAPSTLDTSVINEAPSGGAISGPFTIGRQSKIANIANNNGRYFQGEIAEIIGYSTSLSGTDLQKVKSYLAVKYGITMPVNYLNSAGTEVYNISSYSNGIIGLMRDDASALLQKQSTQQDGLTRLYMSSLAATQSGNSGTFSSDLQSLIVGHDNTPLANFGSSEFPTGQGIYGRIQREWKITNTGFGQIFSMDISITVPPVNPADLRILIDEDGNFSNAQIFNPAISYSNGYVQISGISNLMIPQNSTRYLTVVSMNIATPLPVQWTSFEVVKKEEGVHQLEWQVISERGVYFEVQRSDNGSDWLVLTSMKQPINSGTYFYTDSAPVAGVNYYRIKQTDPDGSFSYSEIKKVVYDRNMRIFPNPTTSDINIESKDASIIRVRIMDITGASIKEINLSNESFSLSLNLSDLTPGPYIVWIDGNVYRIEKK